MLPLWIMFVSRMLIFLAALISALSGCKHHVIVSADVRGHEWWIEASCTTAGTSFGGARSSCKLKKPACFSVAIGAGHLTQRTMVRTVLEQRGPNSRCNVYFADYNRLFSGPLLEPRTMCINIHAESPPGWNHVGETGKVACKVSIRPDGVVGP